MHDLFERLTLTDVQRAVFRNIVSIHVSQDLFDDLSDDPEHWSMAQRLELESRPASYRSTTPIIERPFEESTWFNVIGYPFRNWQASRFSDGSFGVWYGSDEVETTVLETVHHWVGGLLRDAGFLQEAQVTGEAVVAERKVFQVDCRAVLLNLVPMVPSHPGLVDPSNYAFAQAVGARLHREGHPGLIAASARRADAVNFVVLNPAVLSNPRLHCQLSYRLEGTRVLVSRQAGVSWFEIAA